MNGHYKEELSEIVMSGVKKGKELISQLDYLNHCETKAEEEREPKKMYGKNYNTN